MTSSLPSSLLGTPAPASAPADSPFSPALLAVVPHEPLASTQPPDRASGGWGMPLRPAAHGTMPGRPAAIQVLSIAAAAFLPMPSVAAGLVMPGLLWHGCLTAAVIHKLSSKKGGGSRISSLGSPMQPAEAATAHPWMIGITESITNTVTCWPRSAHHLTSTLESCCSSR